MSYDIEAIPDDESIFIRVHKQKMDLSFPVGSSQRILIGAFDMKGDDGLSADWSRYKSAADSLASAKIPEDNGIISLNVKEVREADKSLEVIHDPLFPNDISTFDNRAHSLIKNIPPRKPNGVAIRVKLRDISIWAINYNNPNELQAEA